MIKIGVVKKEREHSKLVFSNLLMRERSRGGVRVCLESRLIGPAAQLIVLGQIAERTNGGDGNVDVG
jgi:hypothetical protein